MANEKRLIEADALKKAILAEPWKDQPNIVRLAVDYINIIIDEQHAVDAVEVNDMREFAQDVAYQFGYYCQNGGRLHITHGGLSTLEQAFDILGWENPHPVPECECEIDGCHEHATCGAPTADGYKRMCGKHCRERGRQ